MITAIQIFNSGLLLNNTQLAIALCTGAFDFEKVLITAWYADKDSTGLTLEKAAEKYPALGMYLAVTYTTVKSEDNWHMEYLKSVVVSAFTLIVLAVLSTVVPLPAVYAMSLIAASI